MLVFLTLGTASSNAIRYIHLIDKKCLHFSSESQKLKGVISARVYFENSMFTVCLGQI